MPTHAERTALLFLSGVLALGAGVRVARALQQGEKPPLAAAAALDAQRRTVDSVRRMQGAKTVGRPPAPVPRPSRRPLQVRTAPPIVRYPIDLDRADSAHLLVLPGVGPALAGRIVAQRDSFGPFGGPAELARRVRGIGPATTARLAPLVTFSGTARGRAP
jgi:competence protein ComEA